MKDSDFLARRANIVYPKAAGYGDDIREAYIEGASDFVVEIHQKYKELDDRTKKWTKKDKKAYDWLNEYLCTAFTCISCDHETEIVKFIERLPLLLNKE